MVIDSSRSIGHKLYPQLRRFVHRLVSKLDVSHDRTNIGILQASDYYSTEYEMMLSEYTDPNEVKSIINEMTYHSGMASFIGSGIEKAVKDNVSGGN